jgi:ribonuclease R
MRKKFGSGGKSNQGSKSKEKEIKNARSLADVVLGKSGGAQRSSPSGGGVKSRHSRSEGDRFQAPDERRRGGGDRRQFDDDDSRDYPRGGERAVAGGRKVEFAPVFTAPGLNKDEPLAGQASKNSPRAGDAKKSDPKMTPVQRPPAQRPDQRKSETQRSENKIPENNKSAAKTNDISPKPPTKLGWVGRIAQVFQSRPEAAKPTSTTSQYRSKISQDSEAGQNDINSPRPKRADGGRAAEPRGRAHQSPPRGASANRPASRGSSSASTRDINRKGQAESPRDSRGARNSEPPRSGKLEFRSENKSANQTQSRSNGRPERTENRQGAGPAARSGDRPTERPDSRIASRPENRSGTNKSASSRADSFSNARSEPPRRQNRQNLPTLIGMIKRHPDGFGFFIPDTIGHPDVYIPRNSMSGVMSNDRVEVSVSKGKGEDRFFGEVLQVLSRANKRVVGKFLPVDIKYGMILDDNKGWGADLRIQAADQMDAKEGDLVAVEILHYPDGQREFQGRVVEVLGDAENPMNDVRRMIHTHGIPYEFTRAAIQDAEAYGSKVTENDIRGREDVRGLELITIDGVTARDFDDAVYVEQTKAGFRLVTAIADVSHYVKPGTALDDEAFVKGTSTYFPNFVVPMLPEALSNELCSLRPDVDRLCLVCDMNLSFEGEIQSFRFFEGVMKSRARVTYGEAQEVIDGKTPSKLQAVQSGILRAADLARILLAKRIREGSLDLSIPETQVVVDETGETSDIIRSERLFAHRLIEELMLVTNICGARYLDNNQVPGIYRIHEEPKAENIKTLERFMWNLGGPKSMGGGKLQKKITKSLADMADVPGSQVLNILTLRAMQQARYSSNNVGHFGLGFEQYSHFTSPIRRYPDLILHRQIKSHIYDSYRSQQMTSEEIEGACTSLSASEQRSVKAERQLLSIKKARFMYQFIDEEFEGLVSSVTRFGVFVLLRQYDVDGLIKIEELGNDRFIFDEENLCLYGKRSGIKYGLGDVLKVRVTACDPNLGKIDFQLVEGPPASKSALAGGAFPRRPGSKTGEGDSESSQVVGGSGEKGMKRGKPEQRSTSKSKKNRFGDEERGSSENDRSNVRKKRFPKRR